jgi:hypothetical protein
MPYITQANIEDVAGTQNVLVWSNLDNTTTTADTDRIAAAISWAEARAHTRLRDRFLIPLQAEEGVLSDNYDVTDTLAKLAASWLYSNRRVQNADAADIPGGWRREAEEMMDSWVRGSSDPNLKRRADTSTTAAVAIL